MEHTIGQLIDPSNIDQYSMRTLRYLCTKNKIQLPLNPNRISMINAILKYQKLPTQKAPIKQKKKISNPNRNSFFSTPPIPLNRQTTFPSAFPTPILPKNQNIFETPPRTSVSPMVTPTLASTPAPLKNRSNNIHSYIRPLIVLILFFMIILFALFVAEYCKL